MAVPLGTLKCNRQPPEVLLVDYAMAMRGDLEPCFPSVGKRISVTLGIHSNAPHHEGVTSVLDAPPYDDLRAPY